MKNADYRKLNDRLGASSKYHKKDGTNVRAILKEETRKTFLEFFFDANENKNLEIGSN